MLNVFRKAYVEYVWKGLIWLKMSIRALVEDVWKKLTLVKDVWKTLD